MANKTPSSPDRMPVPDSVAESILVRSRRCCLCYFLENDHTEKEGQLAHIDRDPSNSSEANLAYLCLHHHNLYDTQYSLTKWLTTAELRHYKRLLHKMLGTERAWEIVIRGNIDDYTDSEINELVKKLRDTAGGLEITLKDINQGSVILCLESETDAFDRTYQTFNSGSLAYQIGLEILDVRLTPPQNIDKLLKLADELIGNEAFQDAIECVNQAIEANPENASAWALKATALSMAHHVYSNSSDSQGALLLARPCSARAIKLEPENATFLAHHAGILHELGEQDEALACSKRSIEIDQNNGLAWYNNGVILYNLGHHHDAIRAFETSLQLGYEKAGYALDGARRQVRRLR